MENSTSGDRFVGPKGAFRPADYRWLKSQALNSFVRIRRSTEDAGEKNY